MKKIFVSLILCLFLLTLVSANLGNYPTGSCVNIKTILNTSSVNISSLSYPNSSIALTNIDMTKNGFTFNYSFCDTSENPI